MPKPRLRLRFGIWSCFMRHDVYHVGFGYTPAEAYRDWQAVQ